MLGFADQAPMEVMLSAGRAGRAIHPPVGSASQWLTHIGFGVAATLLLLGTLAGWSARREAWLSAERQSDNLLLAIRHDIARYVATLDLSLQGVTEARTEPGIGEVSAGIRRHALFDRAAAAEDLGAVVLLDQDGDVVDSSGPLPRGLNFAGREEFAVHKRRDDAGLHLGRPVRSWFDDGEASMWLSRRLTTVDGRFDGVVAGALRLSFFKHLFERIDVGPHGSITLIHTDGHIVWREPTAVDIVDKDVADSPIFARMLTESQGRTSGASPVDGLPRLYTFGRVGTMPLIVTVNFAVDDIYAAWAQKAVIIGPILMLACLAVVFLSLLFRREIARRVAAEQALSDAAEEMSRLAATDALTGLANRRTFESNFSRDWRRALRLRAPLSLLMVDVDHFKRFNDHYGHQDGDRALQQVATAIRDSLASSSAFAARYGGEEFVVLLPDCDAIGARLVAERLRVAVERLDVVHAQSPSGLVTVSVGIATARPDDGDERDSLVALADSRLYAAKRDGRNLISPGLLDAVPAPATSLPSLVPAAT